MNRVTLFHPAVAFTMMLTAIIVSACNQPYSQPPSITNTPIDPNSMFATPIAQTPSMGDIEIFGTGTALAVAGTPLTMETQIPGMATALPGPSTVHEQLAAIDAQNQALMARTAFDAPSEMQFHQPKKIQLLLDPYLAEQELKEQLADPGPAPISELVRASLEMKAELRLSDEAAFSVETNDSDVQLISGTETTEWTWSVTAQKPGSHLVTVVLYRLVTYENKAYWRKVAEYPQNINVKATLLERLETVNRGWLAGLIIALLVIPAFWFFAYQATHKLAQMEKPRQKRTGTSRNVASESPFSRLSSIPRRDSSGSQNLGQIFISYRRSDSADITGRIYDRLVDEYGRSPIFKDVDSIPLGTDFKQYLDRKVGECKVLLAIIGNRWVDAADATGSKRLDDRADFVRVEIESALKRDIPVIPLLVGGAQMPAEEQLPYSLRRLIFKNGVSIRPDPDFHRDMDRLISALENIIQ